MRTGNRGFTLIEVLVALVVLAIGLLGMSSLMMTSMQSNQSAYLRSQASVLAYDLIERMRANKDRAITTDDYTMAVTVTSAPGDPGCSSGSCTPAQQATLDKRQWITDRINSIPGSTQLVTRANSNEYVITISWEDSSALQRSTSTSSFVVRVNL